jgi:hypothetical protein
MTGKEFLLIVILIVSPFLQFMCGYSFQVQGLLPTVLGPGSTSNKYNDRIADSS